ncbi:MAG: SPOR domain-containing protein [Rubrivivax sp.]
MALSSFFKRNKTERDTGPAAVGPSMVTRAGRRGAGSALPEAFASRSGPPHESAAVAQARTQARRRLMGAAVLLLLGVLLFPLVFETQPRPLPLDLPMTVAPGKGGGTSVPAPAALAGSAERPVPPMIIETAEPEPRLAPQPASAVAQPSPAPAPHDASPVRAIQASASAPVSAAPAVAPAVAPAAAALKPAPAPIVAAAPALVSEPGRFVVQVGAFADDAAVRQTRQKVEKLGLKTYTQEVNTQAGKRVRVRVGPFATRDDAVQVLGKLKGAGLPGTVLAL